MLNSSIMQKNTLRFLLLFVFFAGMIILSYAFDLPNRFSADAIRNYIIGKGLWGPVIFFLIYMASALVIFPTVILSIQSGVIWGPVWGTLFTVLASTVASLLPFFLAQRLGHDFVGKWGGAKTRICERYFVKNGLLTILIMRLIPVLPWDTVNYGAGLCGFRFRDYVFATLVGAIPASLTYNLIGDSFGEPLTKAKIAFITLMALTTFGLVLYIQRRRSKKPVPACKHS